VTNRDRERWDARYRKRGAAEEPEPSLVALADRLPRAGAALDVAGGAGRNALWLARRGLKVTLVDISPVALAIVRQRAAAAALEITTCAADLDSEELPAGPWDLIVCIRYLNRALLRTVPELLAPGGSVFVCQPTERNLDRNPRPSRRFLLNEGELPQLLPELTVEWFEEDWTKAGQHDARIFARRS
jgi:tellurite methyltransferase